MFPAGFRRPTRLGLGPGRWLRIAAATILAPGLLIAATANGAASRPSAIHCDRDVTYLQSPEPGAANAPVEWRLFDPADHSDRIWLALPDRIEGVRWDPKFRVATFTSGGWLYRTPWSWGAQPLRVGRLPDIPDLADWWFNPDSSRWQAAAMHEVGERLAGDAMLQRWWVGLWQAAADGTRWRLLRSDTLECDEDACAWPWYGAREAHRERAVPLSALGSGAAESGWLAKSALLDTTGLALPAAERDRPWRLLPLTEPRHRGVAFRALATAESLVSRPFYLVDLERHEARLIPVPEPTRESWVRGLLDERCGLLLIPGIAGEPFVLDAATCAVLFSRPERTEAAAWVPRPRKAAGP